MNRQSVASRADGTPAGKAGATPVWQPTVDRVRQALAKDDNPALIALEAEVHAMLQRPRRELRGGFAVLRLYESLIVWARDGAFHDPYDDIQTARVQFWELVERSGDLEYKRLFAEGANKRFPEMRGFRLFWRVLSRIVDSTSRFRSNREDVQVYRRPGATMTIVGFGSIKGGFAGIGWELFERAVAEPLNANFVILEDRNTRIYLAGIASLGDYPTSVAKVRELLEEFADTRIVATGASGGVFGAINFAADLGVRHVVAFAGPTSIEIGEDNTDRQIYREISADIEAGRFPRVDLATKVNASAIERIDFFVGAAKFDLEQMAALRDRCDKVQAHVYDVRDHVVTDYAIEDGSLFEAFRAGPDVNGLAADGEPTR